MRSGLMPNFGRVQARYGAESERPNLWTGLQALWTPPVTPTGLTWRDQSMHRNDGTLTSMDPASDWVMSPYGWALDFAGLGSGEYVSIPDFPRPTQTFTLASWERASSTNDYMNMIGADDSGSGNAERTWQFRIRDDTDRAELSINLGGGASVAGTSDVADGEWHHIAATFSASGLAIIYVDGKAENTQAQAGALNSGTGIAIGRQSDETNGEYFKGSIADARIWSRTLLPAEIADLYANSDAMLRRRRVVIPSGGIARPLVDGSLASGNVGLVA